jgi:hypothetical protein
LAHRENKQLADPAVLTATRPERGDGVKALLFQVLIELFSRLRDGAGIAEVANDQQTRVEHADETGRIRAVAPDERPAAFRIFRDELVDQRLIAW